MALRSKVTANIPDGEGAAIVDSESPGTGNGRERGGEESRGGLHTEGGAGGRRTGEQCLQYVAAFAEFLYLELGRNLVVEMSRCLA